MTFTISRGSTSSVSSPNATVALFTAPGRARAMLWPSSLRSMRLSINVAGAADFPLQQHDAVDQSFRRRRAAWNIDVDRYDTIAAAHHRVGVVVVAAAICAGSHRDHVTRLGHLVVKFAQRRRHLVGQRTGDNHHVRLTR